MILQSLKHVYVQPDTHSLHTPTRFLHPPSSSSLFVLFIVAHAILLGCLVSLHLLLPRLLLRAAEIHEDIITAFWVQKNASFLAAIDSTAEDLKDTCREASGIDCAKHGFLHKVEWANVQNASLLAKR